MAFATVPAAFAAAIDADSTRPLVTWYDDGTGERAELSGATCANWVAKVANLVTLGAGLGPGDAAAVLVAPHWQTAVVLLGCWSAGVRVTEPPADIVFADADRVADAGAAGVDVYGLALAPMAAPMRQRPPGVSDFVTEVRAYGDHFDPPAPVRPDDLATTVTHQELCRAAAQRAEALGVPAGGRVLINVDAHPDPLDWLLAPLVAGASSVLCRRLDPAALPGRVVAEKATTVVGAPH